MFIGSLWLEPSKIIRSRRRHFNQIRKLRDRSHGKVHRLTNYMAHRIWFRRFEKDWHFGRRKVAPDTGFGVAYEKRPDEDMYRR